MGNHITDKFKDALNSINNKIDKQTELRSNLPVHSKEYRTSLEEEIKLARNKSDILKDHEEYIYNELNNNN